MAGKATKGISTEKYPEPLSSHDSDIAKKKRLSIRATRRVIAPYIKARQKPVPKVKKSENKYFSFYLRQKPSILMSDLSKLLSDEVDLMTVLNETAEVLREMVDASGVTVYMVDESLEEIYQITNPVMDERHRVSYKIEPGTNVAAFTAYQKEFVKINDVVEDSRFPDGLGCGEVAVKAVMCVPVVTPEDECLAVIEMFRELDMKPFEEQHLRLSIVLSGWIGSAIYQNHQRLALQKQQELNDYLLDLTKCYFADTMLLDKLITEMVNFAKITLNAEHGLFFVMKPRYDDLIADLYEEGIGTDKDKMFKRNVKIRLGTESDLVSMVAQKGVTINIRNAYNDTRVNQDVKKGYVTRSVLCMPVVGVDEILGVIQVINKKKGACFSKTDEVLFSTFSVYCAFVLSYARLYEKMAKTHSLNNVYLEMLNQHMQPCIHDYNFVMNQPDVANLPQRFNSFDYYVTDAFETYMPQLVMYMFNEVAKNLFIDNVTMTKFVLIVQKSYHNHPYHNFHHAFNVTHCIYNMLRRNTEVLTQIEMQALILASYCHDIDHYGLTNNFLEITNHHLAQLYEESPLENHHYHVTMFIVKQLGLFSHFSQDDYKEIVAEIRFAILSTDLALYFRRRGRLYQICSENLFEWSNDEHRKLLKAVMMTTADLSGQCKPYTVAKTLTDCVYKEFYNEGDKEKSMGLCPLSIMDREKTNMVPSDQVQFLTVVVLPCTLILTKLLPNCAALYREALKLRDTWKEIMDAQGQKLWSPDESYQEKKH